MKTLEHTSAAVGKYLLFVEDKQKQSASFIGQIYLGKFDLLYNLILQYKIIHWNMLKPIKSYPLVHLLPRKLSYVSVKLGFCHLLHAQSL